MKTKVLVIIVLLLSLNATAQSDSTPLPAREGTGVGLTIKADFVNEYIWRGLKLGDVAVQPIPSLPSSEGGEGLCPE